MSGEERLRQTPVPERAMAVDKATLLKDQKAPDRWKVVYQARDSFGRVWVAEVTVSEPALKLGEEVFPHEWSDGGDSGAGGTT